MPEEHHDPTKNPPLVNDLPRASAIVASLRAGEPSSAEVFDAFWQLDALPADEVRDALAPWTGPLPDPDRLDTATRLAHGLPLPPLRLRTLSVEKDADILDLGPLAEEQLRLAGKSWDGADLAPEERLDGELEGSFAGALERRVLGDIDAPGDTPLFDVLLFGEDAGLVFGAGTTKVVALIAYHKVETRDRRTRTAIEEALAARSATASSLASREVVSRSETVAGGAEKLDRTSSPPDDGRAATPEETLARTMPMKKTAKNAKKATAKKATAKKATAKKATAKKATAKKVTAKKATKAVAKKVPAKKETAVRSARKAAVKPARRATAPSRKGR